ncbi:MAG: Sec-independent protein translocase subunit TatA/TatB [Acidimicrobiales bacterium]
MLSLSPIKIVVIVAVVMLLLGPDKLPEVARKLGSSWRALRQLQERIESEVREAVPDLPSAADLARIARSPVNLLNELANRVDDRESASGATVHDVTASPPPPPSSSSPPPPPMRTGPADTGILPPAERTPSANDAPTVDPSLN